MSDESRDEREFKRKISEHRDKESRTRKERREYLLANGHVAERGMFQPTVNEPHLEEARLKHCIPDICFTAAAMFDRVLAFQIPLHFEETFLQGGIVIAPQSFIEAVEKSTPRAILISAGLEARDHLRAHGMKLGDTIHLVKNFCWKYDCGNLGTHHFDLLVMRSADIVACEETQQRLNRRDLVVTFDAKENQHHYGDENGPLIGPDPHLFEHE